MKPIPELNTERLLLRGITEADLDSIYTGLSNPQVTQYYGVHFESREATLEQMDWFQKSEQYWWAICSLDNGTFYGAAGLNEVLFEQQKAEIGIWLLPKYWGKGMMKESLPLICKFGFEELDLKRIEGFVEVENRASIQALKQLGFEHEKNVKNAQNRKGEITPTDLYVLHRKT